MAKKITLELTKDELLTLGAAMSDYVLKWSDLRVEAYNDGEIEKAKIRELIIEEGYALSKKIRDNY